MKGHSVSEFAKNLVAVLPQVMRGVLRRQNDALTTGKVTPQQFLVLDIIYTEGRQKMSCLAGTLAISLPAMTGLIERLHKMGLIKRMYEENDRRVIRIALAPKGVDVVKSFRAQREKIIAEIFGKLSEKDREEYLKILFKIKEIIREQEEK